MNLIKDLCTEDLFIANDNCRLYSKDKKRRYYYYNKIMDFNNKHGNKKATIIMINPSEANENTVIKTPDNTITNLYNILAKFKEFSSFEVINLYSEINPKPKDIYKQKVEALNETIIEQVLKEADLIIPAWGTEGKFNSDTKGLINKIKTLCKDKDVRVVINKYHCHFTTQCTSLSRNPEFIKYEFS